MLLMVFSRFFFLATFKINLVFYGNDVGVVNDKEVLEADACIGLTRIDVLLPLLQKLALLQIGWCLLWGFYILNS